MVFATCLAYCRNNATFDVNAKVGGLSIIKLLIIIKFIIITRIYPTLFKTCVIVGRSHHLPFPLVDCSPVGESVVNKDEGCARMLALYSWVERI